MRKSTSPRTSSSSRTRTKTLGGSKDVTTSVRKIDNGYLVIETSYSRGKFSTKETFTDKPPKIEVKC